MELKIYLAAVVATGILTTASVQAQTKSSQDLVNALKPQKKVLTRSLKSPKIDPFLKKVRTRQIVVESKKDRERLKKAVVEAKLPSIAITVNFAINSAEILHESFGALNELGEALQNEALSGSKIILNGHTDASGSESYNQELSQRRAASVSNYLKKAFLVPGENLLAIGFGEEQLLNRADPEAAENRRVEIVNLGTN